MSKREVTSRFDEIVEFSGVEKFIDTPIKRYSSGMRLRLGFAVAAHLDPDVLIVDEVLAVGDAGFQKKCLAIMGDLRSGGRTVLFVSHNMAAVENLCSRGVWIDEGRLREDGPAQSVIQSYMGSFASDSQTSVDLGDVKDRRGTGEIRYTAVTFLSPEGHPQGVTRSGEGVVLRFSYVAHRPISKPSFGFRLLTELGTLITETSTWHHAIDIPMLPAGAGVVDLRIESLNLMPSRYVLSIWLTGEGGVVYDGLEHSAVLEVETANIYQSGRSLDSRYGILFFPQRWVINGVPVRGTSEYDGSVSAPSGT
jgi:lipopolysaccharide transport system ATP-binding protein